MIITPLRTRQPEGRPSRCSRRGLTLVEMIASIVVIGVVAAVVTPVVASAGTRYARTIAARKGVERVAFALDRCTQLLRDVPAASVAGEISLTAAGPNLIRLSDGRGLELSSDQTLMLRATDGTLSPILPGVTVFDLACIGADGITRTESSPSATRTIRITLAAGGVELRTAVFPRLAGSP